MPGPRRITLPRHPDAPGDDAARPRMEHARAQLGGAGETDGLAGAKVAIRGGDGAPRVGVVLYASAREVDVWFDGSLVRRTARGSIELLPRDAAHDPLDAVAADVKVFATLREGDRVRWQTGDGRVGEGKLFEKCRYGALVASDDGRVLAVGFRRLWPTVTATD